MEQRLEALNHSRSRS